MRNAPIILVLLVYSKEEVLRDVRKKNDGWVEILNSNQPLNLA